MRASIIFLLLLRLLSKSVGADEPQPRTYQNQLRRIENAKPLLADYPEYFEPIQEEAHFEAAAIVNDEGADLHVRAWRFSYNARGIIEMPNHLRAAETAVIMVHPWAIDDEWGWRSPQPNGVADFCTPTKNAVAATHTKEVVDPFLKRLRGKAACVMYSLPGPADPVRTKIYRSFSRVPTAVEREAGEKELRQVLADFDYTGEPLPETLTLGNETPVIDYFKQFPGLDSGGSIQSRRILESSDPRLHIRLGRPTGRRDLRRGRLCARSENSSKKRRAACVAHRVCYRHVLLSHDGRL